MGLGEWISDTAGDIGDVFVDAYEDARDFAEDALEEIEDGVKSTLALVEETLADAIEAVTRGLEAAADFAAGVGSALINLVQQAGEWIKNAVLGAAEWIADLASDTWTWIKDTAHDAWSAVTSFGEWLADVAGKAWNYVVLAADIVRRAVLTAVWVALHLDDMLWALLSGFICLLMGKDEESYPIIRHICMEPESVRDRITFTRVPENRKYAIFSDHHMFFAGSILDRFRISGNDELYLQVLAQYAQRGYALIENGDLEDLWMREPSPGSLLVETGLELLGGPVGEAMEELFEVGQAKAQLASILANNIHVYGVIRELFHDDGSYHRTIGNHDDPLRNASVREGLNTVYPGITVNDYLLVAPTAMPRTPTTVVTHGQQFDAWNTKSCASMAGEVITEVVSGLSTIWGESSWAAGSTPRSSWMPKLQGNGFPNELEDLTVSTFVGSAQSVDEVELYELMKDAFPSGPSGPPAYPYLVLGHTHTPRQGPRRPGGGRYDKYSNSGTAGRYDGLLWCVELDNGVPEMHVWYRDGGKLIDQPLVGDGGRMRAA